jgi:hypothetical protein
VRALDEPLDDPPDSRAYPNSLLQTGIFHRDALGADFDPARAAD